MFWPLDLLPFLLFSLSVIKNSKNSKGRPKVLESVVYSMTLKVSHKDIFSTSFFFKALQKYCSTSFWLVWCLIKKKIHSLSIYFFHIDKVSFSFGCFQSFFCCFQRFNNNIYWYGSLWVYPVLLCSDSLIYRFLTHRKFTKFSVGFSLNVSSVLLYLSSLSSAQMIQLSNLLL